MDIQKQPGSNGRGNVKRMMTISALVIFTACCVILFYFGVERYQGLGEGWSKFMSVLQSIIIGFGLAFLMNPIMEFFERHMYPFFAKHCKTEENAKKTTRMLTSLYCSLLRSYRSYTRPSIIWSHTSTNRSMVSWTGQTRSPAGVMKRIS